MWAIGHPKSGTREPPSRLMWDEDGRQDNHVITTLTGDKRWRHCYNECERAWEPVVLLLSPIWVPGDALTTESCKKPSRVLLPSILLIACSEVTSAPSSWHYIYSFKENQELFYLFCNCYDRKSRKIIPKAAIIFLFLTFPKNFNITAIRWWSSNLYYV